MIKVKFQSDTKEKKKEDERGERREGRGERRKDGEERKMKKDERKEKIIVAKNMKESKR
jgi:hypothetical protein